MHKPFVASLFALTIVACTQDFEQFRPGGGGGAGSGGAPTTGGGGQGTGGAPVGGQGGEGGGPACAAPEDCANPGECQTVDCVQNACVYENLGPETTCSIGVCSGDGPCVECVGDVGCDPLTETCGDGNMCVTAECDDGEQNGEETDVDCGGAGKCPRCEVDDDCAAGTDCATGLCDGDTCQPCDADDDCDTATQFCNEPTGACTPKGDVGDECGGDDECENDTCVDGFCCDSACDGTCEACSAALTSEPDGVCSFIDSASDPDGECPGGGGACITDVCSGTEARCGYEPAGTDCGPQTCVNGEELQPQCNATGECNMVQETSCNGHVCANNSDSCDLDCDSGPEAPVCLSGYGCATTSAMADPCWPTCTNDDDCPSNNCTEMLCVP